MGVPLRREYPIDVPAPAQEPVWTFPEPVPAPVQEPVPEPVEVPA